ncbi:MAG: hypothetical protein DWI07_00015 [Planctomycetota bacterium]|nr:MAG: hypothetical protein DWI07_00015 [Planctomycetota bacterium]
MATNPALILQFAIHLKQRILKVLLQGQRLVPYQRGPADLVSWPNRKMLWRTESPIHLTSRLRNQYPNGAGFQPLFHRAKRFDLIRYPIDGLRPSLVCDGPLALKFKKMTSDIFRQNIFMCRDLCKID